MNLRDERRRFRSISSFSSVGLCSRTRLVPPLPTSAVLFLLAFCFRATRSSVCCSWSWRGGISESFGKRRTSDGKKSPLGIIWVGRSGPRSISSRCVLVLVPSTEVVVGAVWGRTFAAVCGAPAIGVAISVDVRSAAWPVSTAMWIGGSAGVANSWIISLATRGSMVSGVTDVLFDAAAGSAAHLSKSCTDAELRVGSLGLLFRESSGG